MTAAAARATPRSAWGIWLVAVLAYFIAVTHRSALGVAGVEAIDRFHIEATALSMLSVLQLGLYALMQVPAGSLIDRFGAARVILVGTLVMAVGQALLAFAPTFAVALVARVFLGVGDAPIFIAANRLIAHHFSTRRAPVMVQITGAIGQAGQLATAFPVAFLLHESGWSWAFSALAAVGLAAAGIVFFALVLPGRTTRGRAAPGTLAATAPEPTPPTIADSLRAALRTPGVRLGFWSHWLSGFSGAAVSLLWGVPYFVTAQGRTPLEASGLLAVFVIATIVVGPFVGRLTAYLPMRRSWIVLGGSIVSLADWAILLARDEPASLTHLVIFMAVLSASGPISLVGLDFARSFAREGHMGASIGFANQGGFLAAIIAVFLIGVTLQVVSPAGATEYTLAEYRIAFITQLVPWSAGVIGVLLSRRTTRREMASEGVHVPRLRDSIRRRRS